MISSFLVLGLAAVSMNQIQNNGSPISHHIFHGEASMSVNFSPEEPIDSSGASSYSSLLVHYFDNLTSNFGVNYVGSCGYVALAMMLSYYDATWNSSFVAEGYDAPSSGSSSDAVSRRCSPGVVQDDFASMGYNETYANAHLSGDGYLDYVHDIEDVSLHARLISIGDSLGYYDPNGLFPAVTKVQARIAILSEYLTEDAGFTVSDFSILRRPPVYDNYAPRITEAETAIKGFIDQGFPVLVSVSNSSEPDQMEGSVLGSHAVIAYDYDASNIYYHPGWFGDGYSTHMTRTQMGYAYIRDYMVLIPSEVDSNNPGVGVSVSPGTNFLVSHCADVFAHSYSDAAVKWQSATHFGGIAHSYSNSYVNLSEDTHKAICSCGAYQLVCHDLIPFLLPGQLFTDTFICSECLRRFYGL